jgi:hypothetical protein
LSNKLSCDDKSVAWSRFYERNITNSYQTNIQGILSSAFSASYPKIDHCFPAGKNILDLFTRRCNIKNDRLSIASSRSAAVPSLHKRCTQDIKDLKIRVSCKSGKIQESTVEHGKVRENTRNHGKTR